MAGGAAADLPAGLALWVEALAATTEDPVAEVLALVWGPRFDREQALAMLARLPRVQGAWLHAIQAFGEHFDALPAPGQQALRQALRHIADNAACRASC